MTPLPESDAAKGRRLEPEDAAYFLLRCVADSYRRRCLVEWRREYGDGYADRVEALMGDKR